jgi:hypothetical protein
VFAEDGHARAHLLYGEWLRRENQRLDARQQLRVTHEVFTTIGAEAFAQRAAWELRATGETARKRTVMTSSELAGQEAQIARLVREGLSNLESAAACSSAHAPSSGTLTTIAVVYAQPGIVYAHGNEELELRSPRASKDRAKRGSSDTSWR